MTRALLTLCAIVALLASAAPARADSAESKLRAGQAAVEAGDTEDAVEELEEGRALAKSEGASPGVRIALAVELADLYATYPDLGHEAEAEALYREALGEMQSLQASDAAMGGLYQRVGNYYLVREEWAKAISPLERFLETARAQWPIDRVYASLEASGLANAYGKVGRAEDRARLRKLIDDPLARKALVESAPAKSAEAAPAAGAARKVGEVPPSQLYLEPNARDSSGRPVYVHFGEKDMPLRVALGPVDTPASDGDAAETWRAAAAGIEAWEGPVRSLLPWFRLEVVETDPSAQVQVEWRKRPRGYSGGFGEIRAGAGEPPKVTAAIVLSTQPLPTPESRLTLGEVHVNAMHAFGGALGLGYCWECDSLRSMNWLDRKDFAPTDTDLRTLEALTKKQSGEPAAADVAAREAGVLADLPFLNTGDDQRIFIDIAPPDSTSFVVQLDTGAQDTVLSTTYARALGVATRSAKSDQNWRETVTGRKIGFWVTAQRVAGGGRLDAFNYALLGGEYLQNYVVEIDFARRRVRFLDPDVVQVGGAKPRPGEHVVDMPVTSGWPQVKLELGGGSVLAVLDTGSTAGVSISEEAAAKLGIAVDPNAPRGQRQNVIATTEAAYQKQSLMKVGSVPVTDVELAIHLRGTGVRITRMAPGDETLLGQGVLRRFLVRLDYPRQRLGLTPIGASSNDAR